MKIAHNYYVFIVECNDGSYYTGVTNDVEVRITQHSEGKNIDAYTYSRRPVILKYYSHYTDINQAIGWEKQIKGWSRRKKQALINENWGAIVLLANKKKL